ncbi:hypothetical protein IWQ61_000201 [Dispira simplex]|nr:hypothetical protein IWQ61_000201 [Dispira simplex]
MHTALLATTTVLGTGLLVMGVPAPQSGGTGGAVALPPGELTPVNFGQPMPQPSQKSVATERGSIVEPDGSTPTTVRQTQSEGSNRNGGFGPSGISIQEQGSLPAGSIPRGIRMPPDMKSNSGINNKEQSSSSEDPKTPMSSGDNYSDRLDPQSSSSTVRGKNSTNSTATVDDPMPTDTGNFASLSRSFTIAAGIIPLIAACSMY